MAGFGYTNLEQQFEDIGDVLSEELGPPQIHIQLDDLRDVYDKVQIKKLPCSEQRIAKGKVNGVAWTEGQIKSIRANVERTPEAAGKVSDRIHVGPTELQVSYEKYEANAVHFSVDLDSVYKTPTDELVYSLDKVEVEERNRWQIAITVELIDGFVRQFTSKGFRIRTRPKAPKPDAPGTAPDEVPTNSNKRKRNESGSCHSDYSSGVNSSPQNNPGGSPHSVGTCTTVGDSPPGVQTLNAEKVLTDHLEAQRARIEDLRVVKMVTTGNADIAYHLNLTESAQRRPDLEEGDVIAFVTNAKTGQTEIEKLTQENTQRALMAGVISRSAYLYAHAPSHDVEKGRTETVCVIGIVKVKVLGTVQNGERIYVALDTPAVAVPETQIPLRPMADRSPTLLGQALESQTSYRLDSVHLVRCFVSIVLGIQSGQITNAIDNLQERMQGSFQEVMIKDRSRWLKGVAWKLALVLVFAGMLAALLYIFCAPGTIYQYWKCKKGRIKGHTAYFEYVTYDHQYPKVYGLEFTWEKLMKKLHLQGYCQPYNASGMHYYLNLARCAYFEHIVLDHNPQIRGPELFAVNPNCTEVYYVECDIHKWTRYNSARNIKCKPPPST
ncbi:uncharacterized protein [Porites lutea]|uniref:uncharacterized protein isoform X2 n=1 Tax=Porites lutea TaxID=51062 RepID=UPI003CC6A756